MPQETTLKVIKQGVEKWIQQEVTNDGVLFNSHWHIQAEKVSKFIHYKITTLLEGIGRDIDSEKRTDETQMSSVHSFDEGLDKAKSIVLNKLKQ